MKKLKNVLLANWDEFIINNDCVSQKFSKDEIVQVVRDEINGPSSRKFEFLENTTAYQVIVEIVFYLYEEEIAKFFSSIGLILNENNIFLKCVISWIVLLEFQLSFSWYQKFMNFQDFTNTF